MVEESVSLAAQPGRPGLGISASSAVSDNAKGVILAISSSIFIGASFVIKKNGLRRIQGKKARDGGFGYLREPLWWAGMVSMVGGELANFAAYAFAPAIMVTPLGALSIIVSAILVHNEPDEKLNVFGFLGCGLCVIGSVVIVLHAPEEHQVHSVQEVAQLALQPAFLLYTAMALAVVSWLLSMAMRGREGLLVNLGICSIMGSFTVTSCKGLAIAVKLTLSGSNQFIFLDTYFFAAVMLVCVITQINYLNKALDSEKTAIVSPVYYVMFTVLTIVASIIMFQDRQTLSQFVTETCGFLTIISGTFLLQTTKDANLSLLDLLTSTSAHPREDSSAGEAVGDFEALVQRDQLLVQRASGQPGHKNDV